MKLTAKIETDQGGRISVTPYAPAGVADNVQMSGWGLKPAHGELAKRLARAIEAGAVLANVRVLTLADGSGTYVGGDSRIRARAMNAELRRLGF